ncbi:MAG: DinB family protein [Candidatus Limnocylindria bacterium]
MSAAVDALLARMADAERRLAEHASAPVPSGMTEPDPGAKERWEAGQVWAHVAEFPGYWLEQVERVVELGAHEPATFGRTKTDAARVEAIERDRHEDPEALLARARTALARATDTARGLPSEAWQLRGTHPARGEMTVQEIVERFIVEHLEEHADQLDLLRRV